MKKKRKAGHNWEFDGKTITVRIPMTFARRGGCKVIVAPDGGDAWAPARPSPDEALIRALARAHRWKRLLDEGTYRSAGEIAEAEGVSRSFVSRLLRLTLLAPDIVESILAGRQPRGLRLEELTQLIPTGWQDQRQIFGQGVPEHEQVRALSDVAGKGVNGVSGSEPDLMLHLPISATRGIKP